MIHDISDCLRAFHRREYCHRDFHSDIVWRVAPEVSRIPKRQIFMDLGCIGYLQGKRPIIPEYTPESYSASMKRCWDLIPTDRSTSYGLIKQIGDWEKNYM
ncbi:kinase-like domain-containing protein [Rhizophagus clarus]|uniref:Kinase-like domain-containing protein n=1 Tax=Rhizophagus clarus TaxID=94130 RepID=A0A8H3R0Z5_9GLOM|nr:kinase-like domain-containing protein [Rhizophagus clarus]